MPLAYRFVRRRSQIERKSESERDRQGEHRPKRAVDYPARPFHRPPPRDLCQRTTTKGHSTNAPGSNRMRAPTVTGIC
jgi:hypothetical protein